MRYSVGTVWTIFIALLLVSVYQLLMSILSTRPIKNTSAGDRVIVNQNETRRGIPRIIHQMYKTTMVPEPYHKFMQSWTEFNPDYTYYFWTDKNIRNLIKDHYPDYLKMYDSYKYDLQRAHAGRYFILYHYGGIYADADMECLKPFDDYIANHSSCIIAPEPAPQTRLLYNLNVLYMNAIMICQEQHDFMWQMIQGLPCAVKMIPEGRDSGTWTLRTTGALYMTSVVKKYLRGKNTDIYLAPHEELVPISDPGAQKHFAIRCQNKKLRRVKKFRETCDSFKNVTYFVNDTSQAYSIHHWLHLGYEIFHGRVNKMKKREVTQVLQNVTVLRYVNDDLVKLLKNETNGDKWIVKQGNVRRGIPHIIHQTYKSTIVPSPYHKFMQSWIKFNPTYDYYFWTDEDIRNLVKDHYPDYLNMYDSYKQNLQRADVGRYFILYHYGGIYADADMECVKPFDDYLANHSSCIVVPEPVLQSRILFHLKILYTNAIMICQKHHEFIWQIIQGLPKALKSFPEGKDKDAWLLHTTGPIYMMSVLEKYLASDDTDIYLAPYEELVPISDNGQRKHFALKCKNAKLRQVKEFREACDSFKKVNYYIGDTSRAYSIHRWLHLGYEKLHGRVNKMQKLDVTQVLGGENVIRYGNDDLT